MNGVSLFSGAGGFELGFERAGIRTILQAEQDPWCLEVLARHWPDCGRVTDVRSVGSRGEPARRNTVDALRTSFESGRWETRTGLPGRIDLVYGGFPCQDVSVAGNRAGLGGARSGLWSEFSRVLRELRPTWLCVENVPGLLSSAGGRDFGTILSDLDDLGYGVAWAVLDARYFGVPQRRRRVFIVGCLGNPDAAAAVLAICESGCGHPAPSRETGQGLAYCLEARSGGIKPAWNTTYVAASLSAGGHPDSHMPGRHKEDDVNLVVSNTLGAGGHSTNPLDETLVLARGLTARQERLAGDSDNFVVAGALRASDGHHGHSSPRGDGADNLIAFSNRGNETAGAERLRAGSHGAIPMVSGTVRSHPRPGSNDTGGLAGVRRLTPLECERLMGWPDGWTEYTADGRDIPDSHRYRLCGNGVVATVAEWIGHRLVAVDQMLRAQKAMA